MKKNATKIGKIGSPEIVADEKDFASVLDIITTHRSRALMSVPIHDAFRIGASKKASGSAGESGKKTTEKSVEKSVEKILRYLSENPRATQNELSLVTGLSVRGVEKNLMILKKSGRLRRIGPDKGGHWEVL